MVEEEEEEEQEISQGLFEKRLRQRQRVKSDTAFLVCSEGKCSRPKPGENIFAVNDLKTSASARLPADNHFNRLFEEMLVNSGIDTEDDEQQAKVVSLLEAAKVTFEEDPEIEEFVLDELLVPSESPIEVTTTESEEATTTTSLFDRKRPVFRPFLKSKPQQEFNQEELEEELKFEEELEEEAEAIINESEVVDEEMIEEMVQIRENIKRLKEQIEALRTFAFGEELVDLDDSTEVSVQTATSISIEEDDEPIVSTEQSTTEEVINTSESLVDTTIVSTEESIDTTTREEIKEAISTEMSKIIETTSQPLDREEEVKTTVQPLAQDEEIKTTTGLKIFNAVPVTTTFTPPQEEEINQEAKIEVESFLQDFEPIFDYEGSGEETVLVVKPVQVINAKTIPDTTERPKVTAGQIIEEDRSELSIEETTAAIRESSTTVEDNSDSTTTINSNPYSMQGKS